MAVWVDGVLVSKEGGLGDAFVWKQNLRIWSQFSGFQVLGLMSFPKPGQLPGVDWEAVCYCTKRREDVGVWQQTKKAKADNSTQQSFPTQILHEREDH